jgi:hypothetical protein
MNLCEKREVVIRPEGIFDNDVARRFSDQLSRALPDEVFIIAVLARVLAGSCAARVVVRGLRRHHVRLLRYFGVDVPALEAGLHGLASSSASP